MRIRVKTRGFTLFEVVVYIAIVAVVMTAVLSIVARSVTNRIKAETIYSVTHSTRYGMERMVQAVHSATDVDETDLASNILTVTMADGTIYSFAEVADQLTLSTNGGTAVAITPTDLTVTDFSLIDRTTVGTETKTVEITLGVEHTTPNPGPEYQADFDLTTTVSLRL